MKTAPSRIVNTGPNSFSISRTAKNEGCNIKYTESPIVRGAKSKAEMETPSKVFLILVICSIKLSIRLKIFALYFIVVLLSEWLFSLKSISLQRVLLSFYHCSAWYT
jgi:hypothetical protein